VIQAVLIWTPPTLSIDLFTYLAHGQQIQVEKNPYAEPVKDIQHTAYGEALIERGWLPVHGVSPYGPVWTWIEGATARASNRLDVQIRLVKALAVLFSIVCAWLIWCVLGRVAPERRLAGTLLYLWSPVAIMEFAADGHNDAVALAGVLAALLFTVSARPAASLLALGWGALVKITSLITLPPQAVLWWRHGGRRTVPSVVAATALLGAASASLYVPFWIGIGTLDGVLGHGRPSVQPSTPGMLLWGLSRVYPPDIAAPALAIVLSVGFAAYALRTSLAATDERSTLYACGRVAVAYLLLAPGYWPWYATLPIALLALSPSGGSITAIVLFSLGSRLAAPVERLRLNGLMDWPTAVILSTVIGLWLPAVALAVKGAAGRSLAIAEPGFIPTTLRRIGVGTRRRLARRVPS
jgi:hypothetical protein